MPYPKRGKKGLQFTAIYYVKVFWKKII
uniref:Uncharacterized protein n=1 Tax=Anguilla anguilla TaxID=7936 RepID=A0A0E9U7F8_ANGAN